VSQHVILYLLLFHAHKSLPKSNIHSKIIIVT